MKKFILILTFFLLTGCATKMYYWGNYSSTLYNLKKNQNTQCQKKHMEELYEIISKSQKKNKKPPPGICCEYGYMLLQNGRKDEAVKMFGLEAKYYPESVFFIKRLKDHTLKEKKVNE